MRTLSIAQQNMHAHVFDIQKNVFSDINDVSFYREHNILN